MSTKRCWTKRSASYVTDCRRSSRELKLPTEFRSQTALRNYQEAEGKLNRLSGSAEERDRLKTGLWDRIRSKRAATELLSALRAKISDFGYSPSRVLFELFQNADDAYRQLSSKAGECCFRVELIPRLPGGFRVVHWGRPINHLGPNAQDGRHLGHDRDLLNMLVMNFSEKRPTEDLTGKFGLGFKSVHVFSDSVGIASGFIALRTVGGFVAEPGQRASTKLRPSRKRSGRKATVIESRSPRKRPRMAERHLCVPFGHDMAASFCARYKAN